MSRQGTIITYHPDGDLTVQRRPAGVAPTLAELQALVGGYIEDASRFCGGHGTRTWAFYAEEPWAVDGGTDRNPLGSAAIFWPDVRQGRIVVTHGFDPEDCEPEVAPCDCLSCTGGIGLQGTAAVEAVVGAMASHGGRCGEGLDAGPSTWRPDFPVGRPPCALDKGHAGPCCSSHGRTSLHPGNILTYQPDGLA